MLNIDEGVALVVSKQKTLQLQSVPLALNTRSDSPFSGTTQDSHSSIVHRNAKMRGPHFFLQSTRPTSSMQLCQNTRSTFLLQSLRPASNLQLCQNVRSAFLLQNARPVSRRRPHQHATFAFHHRNAKLAFNLSNGQEQY